MTLPLLRPAMTLACHELHHYIRLLSALTDALVVLFFRQMSGLPNGDQVEHQVGQVQVGQVVDHGEKRAHEMLVRTTPNRCQHVSVCMSVRICV